LKLGAHRTLIQETAARCGPLVSPERLWVVTGASHAAETARQLPDLPRDQLLIEPAARNTAPCIGLAAICVLASDPDALMLVLPSDHVISPAEVFQDAVRRAAALVSQHPLALVLFGVPPTFPATGFGYIRRGEPLENGQRTAYRVMSFQEKPNLVTATRYVAAGDYYWNCGIFIWRARAILEAIAAHAPDIYEHLEKLQPACGTSDWDRILAAEFPAMPSISIDYAVLERAPEVFVVPAPFQWDDVGSWQALARLQPPDAEGNLIEGLYCGVNTSGCIVRSDDEHLVTAIGVRDLIIVHTPTATLVADKRDENSIRELIAELERRGLERFL
jgi:mannose-1-phosphate guanylyltransferase